MITVVGSAYAGVEAVGQGGHEGTRQYIGHTLADGGFCPVG